MKKLLLVGFFSQDASQYTYARSFVQPLEHCGFQVETFNYRSDFLPGWCAKLSRLNTWLVNRALLKKIYQLKPDVIFFIKAETIFCKTMHAIKKMQHSYCLNFYPDSPFALWNGNATPELLRAIHLFDEFLIWSHELIPALISAGCQKVTYFPFAYDEDLFKSEIRLTDTEQEEYASDVCFVGTWEPEREKWLELLCQRLPNINLAIWGNNWLENVKPGSALGGKIKGGAIYKREMRKVFKASKIVLNFIRQQNIQAHNMRTFEVPASKSFILTQWTHDQAADLFVDGESIVCFKTIDDLVEKVIFYCSNDEARARITERGFVRVQNFTLEKQLRKLFLV